jgi:predicted  nucleic acid-binding Zn-ribbon protein
MSDRGENNELDAAEEQITDLNRRLDERDVEIERLNARIARLDHEISNLEDERDCALEDARIYENRVYNR